MLRGGNSKLDETISDFRRQDSNTFYLLQSQFKVTLELTEKAFRKP